ncbi:MAG: nucleotide sugar dehydrogenase [Desulfovibrionaceae bacterium]|nr:nucleotide sugar dehydrogenase [Desulfovibrionaceae bacterium]
MITDTDILIGPESTILDGLKQLTETKKKHLIVVDGDNVFQGIVTDGDIRRSLVAVGDLQLPIRDVMNREPVVVNEQAREHDIRRVLTARMSIVPVVDKNSRYRGYYSFHRERFMDPARNRSVTIIGMGYVGLTLGVVLADSGFRVHGYDVNDRLVDQLRETKCPFYEKGLQKYLSQHANKNLKFTSELGKALSDVYIITVGTPLVKDTSEPNISYLESALTDIGKSLQVGNLIILRSTVPIHTSRQIAIPLLERESGLKCGRDFMLSFAPERTAEGQALKELLYNPQIIGAYDPSSYAVTAGLFNTFTSTIIDVGSLEAAELCKLIDNTFRDHLFAYTNNLVPLADKLGLDLTDIIDAINLGYHRNAVPKPSPGVGGPCLTKDPHILGKAFTEFGLGSELLLNVRRVNEVGPEFLFNKLNALLESAGKQLDTCKKIVLVGLAFKGCPETSDMRESTSLWFLDKFPKRDNIHAYDPVVENEDIASLGITPIGQDEIFSNADAVVILNNHKQYETWDLSEKLGQMNTPAVVLDGWNIFPSHYFKRHPGIFYGGMGHG